MSDSRTDLLTTIKENFSGEEKSSQSSIIESDSANNPPSSPKLIPFIQDNNIVYKVTSLEYINDYDMKICSALFTNNYGIWASPTENQKLPKWIKPGSNIRLTPQSLKTGYLFNDKCELVTATFNGRLVGQLFFTRFYVPLDDSEGNLTGESIEIRWATQLVVDKDFRQQKIGTRLLFQSLGAEVVGYGVATSNPYTVRALENATQQKCTIIKSTKAKLLLQEAKIPYLLSAKEIICDKSKSFVNSEFFIDHTEINKSLAEEKMNDRKGRWQLGDSLPSGFEFFAFVAMKPKISHWSLDARNLNVDVQTKVDSEGEINVAFLQSMSSLKK